MVAIGFRVAVVVPLVVPLVGLALAGCSKQADGMPPSTEWRADTAGAVAPRGNAISAVAAMGHAGDSQALPPGHPPMDTQRAPHGTIGTDVSKMGLPAPDPARALDPTHHVRGVLGIAPGLEGRVHDGGAVFVIVARLRAELERLKR